jgi:hypothetical protein
MGLSYKMFLKLPIQRIQENTTITFAGFYVSLMVESKALPHSRDDLAINLTMLTAN